MTAYVINGIGRCGTTLISDFLMKHYRFYGFIKDLRKLNNTNFPNNVTIKTHSLFPFKQNKSNVKVLFMYGNIYDSVVSYKRKKVWSNNILIHLFADHNIGKNHLETDIFEFGRYLKQWYKPQGYPVMFARYEKMYDNLPIILKFLDLPSQAIKQFPKYVPRKTNWESTNQNEKNKIINIYEKDQKIFEALPDIKLFK